MKTINEMEYMPFSDVDDKDFVPSNWHDFLTGLLLGVTLVLLAVLVSVI
jgi:hypothetical protein